LVEVRFLAEGFWSCGVVGPGRLAGMGCSSLGDGLGCFPLEGDRFGLKAFGPTSGVLG